MKFKLKQKQLKLMFVLLAVFVLVSPFRFFISAQEAEVTPTVSPTTVPTETVTPTEAPTEVPVEPTETPTVTPDPTITPTPTSEVEVESMASPIPLVEPTPTPETTVNTEVVSTSDTGDSVVEGGSSSQTDIDTGDGQSVGEATNVVESETDTGVTTTADVLANTGVNQVTDTKSLVTTISTGDALAYFNLVNFINNQIHDSTVQFYFITLGSQDTNDTDVNLAWQELLTGAVPESTSLNTNDLNVLKTGTETQVDNQILVEANTGTNSTTNTGGIVVIRTGDAKALANVINLINNNLVSSKYFIGTINIEDGYQGDLILPRIEDFSQYSTIFGGAQINKENVSVDSQVIADANSGSNSLESNYSAELMSGDATSISNAYVEVNGNYFNQNSFFLLVNNLGNWDGQVLGWSSPNSTDTLIGYVNILEKLLNFSTTESYLAGTETGGEVDLNNNILVSADSGNNSSSGNRSSQISTGSSVALANLFNFLNINYFNNNRFLGIVNILGNWGGKIIFAYPDVAIGIKAIDQQADGSLTVEVFYENLGIDKARNVTVDLNTPDGFRLSGESSGFEMNSGGNKHLWKLGDLKPGEKGNFRAIIDTRGGIMAKENSWWDKLVGQVMAAENDFLINAQIKTSDPETDTNNNVANLNVFLPDNDQLNYNENSEEDRLANLSVSAVNNVGNWVYPLDIVTFDVNVANLSDVPVLDAVLYHFIFDEQGNVLTRSSINIGLIKPGVKGKVVFGVTIPKETKAGNFVSVSYVAGYSKAGSQLFSNEFYTDFLVVTKGNQLATIDQVEKKGDGEVMGVSNTFKGKNNTNDNLFFPFLMLFLGSSTWLRIKFGGILDQLYGGRELAVKIKDYLLIGTMMLIFGITSHQLLKTKSFNYLDTPVLSWQETLVSGKEVK